MTQLTIGKLAELTGITADTLRYYEKMKLVKADSRSAAGYRLYSPDTVKLIRFIRGAKALNFTLEEIRRLLALTSTDTTTCAEILKHTEQKITEAENKIEELKTIKTVLSDLVKRCPGDDTSIEACPILDHIRGKAGIVLLAVGLAFSTPHHAQAKPISYTGGIMVMQENDETGHTFSLDYTITPDYAIGWYDKWEDNERNGRDYSVHGPEFNTLIKRWNLPDGQANIFNSTGAGIADGDGKIRGAAWTSMLADYETRRVYSSYELRGMAADDINNSIWQRARLGVAPYAANYNDIASWFMVQLDDHPSKTDTVVVTPLVRFFYKSSLIETGYSSNHRLMANWELQF